MALVGCVPLGWKPPPPAPASTTTVVVAEPPASSEPGSPAVSDPGPPASLPGLARPAQHRELPFAVGENHTCQLSPTGQVSCWGYNMQGQLGVGSTQHPAAGVVQGIGDPSDGPVRAIAAGDYQTCALTQRGRVWCWGQNHEGQVGSGQATEAPIRTPTLVPGLDQVAQLALGDLTSCAITTSGALYCWGENAQAQIDDSGERRKLTPTRVAGFDSPDLIAVGNYHLCIVRGGRVACRGSLARLASAIATLDDVDGISAGWEHSCVLRRGVPLCFGRSYLGVLGAGRVCPVGASSNCDADVVYPPAPVPGVSGAVEIDTHDYHSCVRLASGTVTCWGNNQANAFSDTLPAEPFQTAHPVPVFGQVDAILVGGNHTCALRGAALLCAGNDQNGAVRGAPVR